MAVSKAKKLQTQEEREEAIKKALAAIEKETEELKDEVEDLDEKENEGSKEAEVKEDEKENDGESIEEIEEEKEEEDKEDLEEVEEEKESTKEEKKVELHERVSNEEKTSEIEERTEKEGVVEEGKADEVMEERENKEEETREAKMSSFGPIDEDKNQNSLLWKFIYIVAFFVGVGGAILIYQVTSNGQPQEEQVAEEISPTSTPEPTAAPDFSDFPITVQNGSGEAGVAAAGQELLEDADFNVEDTGNADNYDYTETVISAGEDVPQEVLTALRETLEEEYVVADDIEELDEPKQILVIIGSETQ